MAQPPYASPTPLRRLIMLVLLLTSLAAVDSARAQNTAPATRPASTQPANTALDWAGPERDFRVVDGKIMGPWWQGGGPGVFYFTGRYSQKHRSFERVGRTIAEEMGRPYQEIHKQHLQASEDDSNGILVYPDGTARVRLLIMPGGNSMWTMCEVAGVSDTTVEAARDERAKFAEARKVPKGAFNTGMNYVGACAGFFTGASGYTIPRALHAGWGLWPGRVSNIGPGQKRPFPDVVFDEAHADHPLVKAAEGGRLRGMYYNGGPVGPEAGIADTEYLGKYVGGAMPELIDDTFLVAYKSSTNLQGGRAVMTTGHPEVHHPDFLLAMARYAVDREYEVPRRALTPGKPVQAVAGDGQMQYWSVELPAGKTLTVTLEGMEENCDLYLRADLPPTFKLHDVASTNAGRADETASVNFSTLVATDATATWFIGVHGRHIVLNGARFTLTARLE